MYTSSLYLAHTLGTYRLFQNYFVLFVHNSNFLLNFSNYNFVKTLLVLLVYMLNSTDVLHASFLAQIMIIAIIIHLFVRYDII